MDIFILIYLNKEYNKTILFMFQYNLIKNASLLINIMLIIRVIYIIIVIIIVNYELRRNIQKINSVINFFVLI